VAKSLLCDLWMDAARQQVRRMAVSQIVEADPWQGGAGDEADELVGEAVWLQRLTVGPGNDVHVVRLPHSQPQQLFGLARLVPAQLLNGQCGNP
jgi:hypothetical protein